MLAVGGTHLSRAVLFGLLLAAIACGFVGWAMERQYFLGAGTLIAMPLMAYFGMVGTWDSAYLADYWGGILVLLSFGLLLNRLTYSGVIAALLAGLTREQIWLWIVAVGLGLAWLALRRKRWQPLAVLVVGFFVDGGLFVWHWHTVSTYHASMLDAGGRAGGMFGLQFVWTGMQASLQRVSNMADFITTPFTLYRFSPALFVAAGIAFLAWRVVIALRAKRVVVADLAALAFLGGMVVFLFAQPYSSQYWGVMFMPLALATCAGLFVALVGLATRSVAPDR